MPSSRSPTLRDLYADGSGFIAYCLNRRGRCSHSGEVAIDNLIQHLGWDFPYIAQRARLVELLVCSKCGAKRPDIQRSGTAQKGAGQGGHSLTPTGVATPVLSLDISYAEALERARQFRQAHPTTAGEKYGGKGRRRWGRR